VKVPSLLRKKPWLTRFASRYNPVICPAGFIDVGIVRIEPGGSNSVIVPSLSRRKPRKTIPSYVRPAIWPAGVKPTIFKSSDPGTSKVIKVPSFFRRKPWIPKLASKYTPAICPLGFIDSGIVAVEPGTSNVVIVWA
jgi:hypothetical protein